VAFEITGNTGLLQKFDEITGSNMARLTRGSVTETAKILELFRRLQDSGTELTGGINRTHDVRKARIESVSKTEIGIRLENFETRDTAQLYLNFELDQTRYFFSSTPTRVAADGQAAAPLPAELFRAERRDYSRKFDAVPDQPVAASLRSGSSAISARVVNQSDRGLAVEISAAESRSLASRLTLQFDAESRGDFFARVCHKTPDPKNSDRVLVGLSLSEHPLEARIPIERRDQILGRSRTERFRDGVDFVSGTIRTVPQMAAKQVGVSAGSLPEISVVEYPNDKGETIRAIVDSWGDTTGAPAIVIPPAWGRTKETLLPLAATIVESFRKAREPVTVIRFDGTHRRGESHLDPECRPTGEEYLHFTFSQAVRDIESTVRFLDSDPRFQPPTVALSTFSLASLAGRRAVARDLEGRFSGWVSAVGMVDLQSALRTISGGIDFAFGLENGVRFGRHELVGVIADMDHTGLDAIEHQMVYLEDARRDMAEIKVPVTWIHGRYDAWMDVDRVQDIMSVGITERRRLIEVPTGHQLRTSRQALATFQLIAEEVASMVLKRRITARLPRLDDLQRRQKAERDRIPRPRMDLRGFWGDYLLGRDRRLGMQLITATAAYRNFMATQVRQLNPLKNQRIADLGAGTGEFPLYLARSGADMAGVVVDEVDYVRPALRRGVSRLQSESIGKVWVNHLVADFDGRGDGVIPVSDEAYDSVLASLVVSYLANPDGFLREVFRVLRPGGTLVVSTLRRDADISKLFVDGMSELEDSAARQDLGADGIQHFDELARKFLNDASKILDLEEQGRFQFWDPVEFRALVESAGFVVDRVNLDFGAPPQAVIVSAHRP
jgi:ubiquinone/menaquinone biosynthesis C-methylase UbiE/pimeloyl-ACP methyl ester carboxylesterase